MNVEEREALLHGQQPLHTPGELLRGDDDRQRRERIVLLQGPDLRNEGGFEIGMERAGDDIEHDAVSLSPFLHFFKSSARNHPSTFLRAQGVFRKNVRLDFTLGSWRKQRIGMQRPISAHPCRSTSWLMMASSVIPCNGSRGWEMGDGWFSGAPGC